MKTKLILLALVSAAATSALSANAGIHVGFSVGLPAIPTPIYEVAPACPGVDYVWSPGYWSYRPTGYVWTRGAWNYRAHAAFDDHARFNDHDGFRGHDYNDHRR